MRSDGRKMEAEIIKKVDSIKAQCLREENFIRQVLIDRKKIDAADKKRLKFFVLKSLETVQQTSDLVYTSAILVSLASLFSKGWDFERANKIIDCIQLPSKKKVASDDLSKARGDYIELLSNKGISRTNAEEIKDGLFNIPEMENFIEAIKSRDRSNSGTLNKDNKNKSNIETNPIDADLNIKDVQQQIHTDEHEEGIKKKDFSDRIDITSSYVGKFEKINRISPIMALSAIFLVAIIAWTFSSNNSIVTIASSKNDRDKKWMVPQENQANDNDNQNKQIEGADSVSSSFAKCNAPPIVCGMLRERNTSITTQTPEESYKTSGNQSGAEIADKENQSPESFYQLSKEAFDSLSEASKIDLQIRLIAVGSITAVPNLTYNHKIHQAINKFYLENQMPNKGQLSSSFFEKLNNASNILLSKWRIQNTYIPVIGMNVWVPAVSGLRQEIKSDSVLYTDPNSKFGILYQIYRSDDLSFFYNSLLLSAAENGEVVDYKIMKSNFFAFHTKAPGGGTSFVRFHKVSGRLIGFLFMWKKDGPDLFPERLVNLISSSFYAKFENKYQINVPEVDSKTLDDQNSSAQEDNKSQTPPSQNSDTEDRHANSKEHIYTGSGFLVSSEGMIITNAHVIDKCNDIQIKYENSYFTRAKLVAKDITNDLALLSTKINILNHGIIRVGVRVGEEIAAYGFPLQGILATSGNFSLGFVSSVTGMGDDTRYFQISAPVQPGNSGGPVVDQSGNIVGVVTSKLDAQKISSLVNDIPQNVNFAIKSSGVMSFLDANNVHYDIAEHSTPLKNADLAEKVKAFTVLVRCTE